MKCIKNIETGEITRVYDYKASSAIKSKKFAYCSKSEFKAAKIAEANK